MNAIFPPEVELTCACAFYRSKGRLDFFIPVSVPLVVTRMFDLLNKHTRGGRPSRLVQLGTPFDLVPRLA